MKKVIVTGANGFVGSYTTEYCLSQGVEVLAVDAFRKPARMRPHPLLNCLQCDVADVEKMRREIPIGEYDTWIHFAWKGSAGEARFDYQLQMQNVLDTVACLKLSKELGCTRFVGAGSIMEYEVEAVVHAQGSRPGPGYIYGMAKQTAHSLCKAVAVDLGIELLWPMITNAYGAGELSPRFINNTLRKILRGEALRFTSAMQNYDFVYVTDVARAFYLIAQRGKPFYEYMIGSGRARPLRQFIEELGEAVAPDVALQFGDIPYTGKNLPIEVFSIDALERDCGFEPTVTFREGVKETMRWIEKCIRGGRQNDSIAR